MPGSHGHAVETLQTFLRSHVSDYYHGLLDSRFGLTEGSLLHNFAEPSGFTSISYNR